MEPLENSSSLAGENFLEVPTLCDLGDDDEDVKVTFKPRFSPLPRRRSSVSSDDADSEAPSNIARKVSFADAFGLDLVSVKEFDTWEIPTTSHNDTCEDDVIAVEEFYLSPVFQLPTEDAWQQEVRARKVVLESLDFQPGFASIKGIVRVLNVAFEKSVYVRMSLDGWLSYYDLLAEYVAHSCDGETDQFSFKIALVPPYQKDGAVIEFCIRYETPVGTFWANNKGSNYVLLCYKKETQLETEKRLEDVADRLTKSCLKTIRSKEDEMLVVCEEGSWNNSMPPDTIPEIVYPEEYDTEEIDESIDVKALQHGRHNERELELLYEMFWCMEKISLQSQWD